MSAATAQVVLSFVPLVVDGEPGYVFRSEISGPELAGFLGCDPSTATARIRTGDFPGARRYGTAQRSAWRVPACCVVANSYGRICGEHSNYERQVQP